MKLKPIITSILFTSILVTGCATNDEAGDALDRTINEKNELDQYEAPSNRNDEEITSQLGYVRYNEDEINTENTHYVGIDRNKMADIITRLILSNDNFEDVATLVTDEEVLIAYNQPEEMEREKAATIAKKTALSVLPRFYHVYVSDQPTAFKDIQSLQNSLTVNDDYENTLQTIIDEMKKAPQGEPVNDSNENYDNEDDQNHYKGLMD
ncbi:YhcN/YlaJ family sporulation lipoprotein [Aquibacillus salsiterrae]|uniref:YhcN/YlaJ family sporulation lipoprotein n=1 Tax=Aquibacillus salsiterrae TaxID=2950439 RepID=A0A9X3WFT8_9BACI|nr:YhcN/YlaJ family sporulation lipoprotein [Aquibacillus salsiterrae]MDC3417873.1 YhcN/YlaJ family sporulation lipoprotein [Aquibacillus salsiterrae]